MAYRTTSRTFPPKQWEWSHTKNGKLNSSGTSSALGGYQTTMSWRTSPASQRDSSQTDDIVDSVSKQTGLAARGELNRSVRASYKDRFDTGHDFSTERQVETFPITGATVRSGSDLWVYRGHVLPPIYPYDPAWPALNSPSSSIIDGVGRAFIKQTTPTAPEADLGILLAETAQRLPQMIGASLFGKGRRPPLNKSAGDEYLNYQFGLAPTGRELGKIAATVLDSARLLKQYQRDSGKSVRRKRSYSEESYISNVRTYGGEPVIGPNTVLGAYSYAMYFPDRTLTTAETLHERKWSFSSAYTYHLSEAHGFLGKIARYEQQANHLLGTRLTPELIWNLAPWSWMADWFADFGTFMSNVSALSSDSTVLRYGYVMCHSSATRTVSQTLITPSGERVGITLSRTTESKSRRKSSPYGFGQTQTDWSPSKWAILAALGLTRSPRSLR